MLLHRSDPNISANFRQKLLIFDAVSTYFGVCGAKPSHHRELKEIQTSLHAFAPLRLQYISKCSSRIANFLCRLHMLCRLWCEAFAPQRIKKRFKQIQTNFRRLVLFCIDTKFCKKIFVGQHFSSSTRFASFCTAAISKFSQKIGLKNQQFLRKLKFSKKFANVAKFAKICQISKKSA